MGKKVALLGDLHNDKQSCLIETDTDKYIFKPCSAKKRRGAWTFLHLHVLPLLWKKAKTNILRKLKKILIQMKTEQTYTINV